MIDRDRIVEAMARAISAGFSGVDGRPLPFAYRHATAALDAALAVMMEPSEAMVEAGYLRSGGPA